MQPIRMLAPLLAMLVGLTCQPLALLAAEGMKQPKPVLTAEPWNAWVQAEGYDENAPLPYEWSTPDARPKDSKKPPIGDPDWGLITGDGRVQGRGCIGDFRYPACIAETMLACSIWSLIEYHPICDVLRGIPGNGGSYPRAIFNLPGKLHPWSQDVYYILRMYRLGDLVPEALIEFDETGDEIALVIFARWCQPSLEYEIRPEKSYANISNEDGPYIFKPDAPKDQCVDLSPDIISMRREGDIYRFNRPKSPAGRHDGGAFDNWFRTISPYPERK